MPGDSRFRGPTFWVVCAIAYSGAALLYLPSLNLGPISLDDAGSLRFPAALFGHDRFGHWRPIKNALFLVLSRHAEWLPIWRAVLLGIVLGSASLSQALVTQLLGSRTWGLLATLCWLLNPITANVISWLSTANLAICLLGILGFVYFAERSWLVALASLLIALLSHELGFVAPLLWIALHGRMPRRRISIASAACISACLILQLWPDTIGATYRTAQHPRALLMLSAPRYLFENLRLWFWLPGRFGVLPTDQPSRHVLASVVSWLCLIPALGVWWRLRGRDRCLEFALLWVAATLVPVINLVPIGNTPVAMHYLYLPGVGLALALTRLAQRVEIPIAPAVAIVALIAAWLPEQQRSLHAWQSAESLYVATLHNDPDNVEARVNLAAIYLDERKYAQAEALLVDTAGDYGLAVNRFKLLAETGRRKEALEFFASHSELNTPEALLVYARLLQHEGQHEQAAAAFRRAFERARDPETRFTAGYQLALALVRAEDYRQAETLIDQLLREFPDRPELRFSKDLLSRARY
jgi:Tfp pilus assembly protein PilF